MASHNGDNYKKKYVDVPRVTTDSGEIAGRRRVVFDKILLPAATAANDTINFPYLPKGALILDATVKIDKTLGATGIFELGLGADTDALVSAADGGGQAVLKKPILSNVGIHSRLAVDTQIIAKCTEVMDGTVADATMSIEVEYTMD